MATVVVDLAIHTRSFKIPSRSKPVKDLTRDWHHVVHTSLTGRLAVRAMAS